MRKSYILAIALLAAIIIISASGCSVVATQPDEATQENAFTPPAFILPHVPPTSPPEVAPGEEEAASSEDEAASEPTPEPPAQSEPPAENATLVKYVRSKVNGLNIRALPDLSGLSLGHIDKGDMVLYSGVSGNWYKTYYRGKVAYLSAADKYTEVVEMQGGSERTEAVIYVGTRLLGTPYVYGATRLHDGQGHLLKGFTEDKFDCSSFTQYAYYYGANVLLGVTTRAQVTEGREVDKAELRRGDLMYFTNASRQHKTGIERIGHVAIYLGDNYILHTASDYAVIEPMTIARWNYLISIRRHLE